MNKIKTNGAMMVTELLFTHDKLLSLNLGNNKIDHDGAGGLHPLSERTSVGERLRGLDDG